MYVERTRPRAMPLATMTMKTQTHGFLNFYPCTVVMGLRSAALRAAVELRYYLTKHLKELFVAFVKCLWSVRRIIVCFCHEVIHLACCLIDDCDCKNVMASEVYNCLKTHAASNPSFRTKAALIVLSDLRSSTKLTAGTAMMFT